MRRAALAVSAVALALATSSCGEDTIVFGDPEPWKDPSSYPGVGTGKLIVTNSADDTISLIDLATLEPVTQVPIGQHAVQIEGPHHAAAHPGAPHYFVGLSNNPPFGSGGGPHGSHGGGTADGYVLKLRAADNAVLGVLRVDRSPGDLRLTPDGKTLIVSHFDLKRVTDVAMIGGDVRQMDSRVVIIDAERFEKRGAVPVCPAAHGIAPSPDNMKVYVTCYASDELAVVDLTQTTFPVTRHPLVPVPATPPATPSFGPYAASISPADGTVWVSGLEGQGVRVFDPATASVQTQRTVSVAPGPVLFGDFTPDGTRYFVPQQGTDVIIELDTTQTPPAIVRRIAVPGPMCGSPHAVKLLDAARLLVVCEGRLPAPGALAVIELAGGTISKSIPTGLFPDDVAFLLP